jgi:methionyl-tRNA formyltransferase
MRIIFMGTPDPARRILETLLKIRPEIVLVVTQPDRKSGRGQKVGSSPVAELAAKLGLPTQKPQKIKDPVFISIIKSLAPDMIIVVAYGKILPKEILSIPRYGCINLHASLLPKYRGAAPVQWAILNGEKETGVTIMQLDAGLDTGPILAQKKVAVDAEDTTVTLMDKLFVAGIPVLRTVLKEIENSRAKAVPQDNGQASFAPSLRKEEGILDFKKTAQEIRNRVRAFEMWPGAYTFYKGKMLKVFCIDKNFVELKKAVDHGEVVDIIKNRGLVVAAADYGILVKEVQGEGGRRMGAYEFVLGHGIKIGDVFPS